MSESEHSADGKGRKTWDISAGGPSDLNQKLTEYYGIEEIWHSPDFHDDRRDETFCEVLTYWDGDEEHYVAHDVPVYGHGPSGAVGCFIDDLPSKELVRAVVESIDGGYFPPDDLSVCEGCGGWIDFRESGPYLKTADDRFWHDECHDATKKLDRVEQIREDLLSQIVPEDCFDGLSDGFHNTLDQIQSDLDSAVRHERLKHDQQLETDVIESTEGRPS